jgi:hypothetical protein
MPMDSKPAAVGNPGPVLFTLDVDRERFSIRRAGGGGTAYDWLSGPNEGYGFGSSGTPNRPAEEHHRHRHERVVELALPRASFRPDPAAMPEWPYARI